MRYQHISDAEIQQYVLDSSGAGIDTRIHLEGCGECREKVETYRMIVLELSQLPALSFSANLSERVLDKIHATEAKRPVSQAIWWAWGIALLAVPAYIYRKYLLEIPGDLQIMPICLLAGSAMTLLVFLGLDTYRKYRRKLEALNIY
jgi:hypothetical protein